MARAEMPPQSFSHAAAVKKHKLVVLGEQSVGKTSIITQFMCVRGRFASLPFLYSCWLCPYACS